MFSRFRSFINRKRLGEPRRIGARRTDSTGLYLVARITQLARGWRVRAVLFKSLTARRQLPGRFTHFDLIADLLDFRILFCKVSEYSLHVFA